MAHPELNLLTITAELLRTSLGASGDRLVNHVYDSYQTESAHHLVLTQTELQAQGVSCPPIAPLIESTPALGEVSSIAPPVECNVSLNASGEPELTVNVLWPEPDKPSLACYAINGSNTVLCFASPGKDLVNLQTVCGGSGPDRWIMRSFGDWHIFDFDSTDDFIVSPDASAACFDAVNRPTPITIKDSNGVEHQLIFAPSYNGDQAAFQPLKKVDNHTLGIIFNEHDEDSVRTLQELQSSLAEQLSFSLGEEVQVPLSGNFLSADNLLPYAATPTPLPTVTPEATPTPDIVASMPPETLATAENIPMNNISVTVTNLPKKTTLYIPNPEKAGVEVENLRNLAQSIVTEQTLNEQISKAVRREGWFWNTEPGEMIQVEHPELASFTLSRVLHISYDQGAWGGIADAQLHIIGEDEDGRLMVMTIPLDGRVDNSDPNTFELYKTKNDVNETRLKLTLSPTNNLGQDSETTELLQRLFEGITEQQKIGQGEEPRVYIVPSNYVPTLLSTDRTNNLEHELETLYRQTPEMTLRLASSDPLQPAVAPEITAPTTMSGTFKEMVCQGGTCWVRVEIERFDLTSTAIAPEKYLSLPAIFNVWVPVDNIIARPKDLEEKPIFDPTQKPELITNTPTALPPEIMTPTPTPPYRDPYLSPEEQHQMDPRNFPTPQGNNSEGGGWSSLANDRTQRLKNQVKAARA